LISEIKRRKFDVAILPHRSFLTGLISYFARIPKRVGFAFSAGSVFYTVSIGRESRLPEPERLLGLLKYFAVEFEPCPLEVFPNSLQQKIADDFLQKNGLSDRKFFIVAPGSVWGTKRYPPEKFARTIDILTAAGVFDSAVLIGGKSDISICEKIIRETKSQIYSACGMFDILTSTALIKRSSLLIGNDSAPAHIAPAVGTPVAVILGPTIKDFGFAPYGKNVIVVEPSQTLDCRPCSPHGRMVCPKKNHACMNGISPQEIAEAASKLILR
jgi:heptosyltransferase-2